MMATSSEVIEWSALWRLAGDTVICRKCSARQKEIDQANPFRHQDNCLHMGDENFPWRELDQPSDDDFGGL
ncbi:hypothetical protein [Pseudomonas syringae]|uniref:Uncharacterized protein n=1 Tax=Pseudomonas syringae TaxID=317 RepID=A0A085V9L4_PSESX|nr:hypothetical protein [Pseudomonas syringae]KFE52127.1 hypothetical protein IV02_10245 [Pseudomonas syringae]